ncbi:MFS transporter TsgA [Buchnera aphidicola (Taiwanaphis decaspermi)]|uniref:MFS transporter TsgA n=1 Tax=Buchnera aphidicola TaxID=9 RepID=UPI0031B84FEE
MIINKKNSLTFISFLSYAFTGALVIVTGIIINQVSEYFQIPLYKAGNIFSFLNTGILCSIFLNSWMTNNLKIKKQLIYNFILVLISIICIIKCHNIKIFSLSLFVLGIVSGITMSIGTFLITYLYNDKKRAAKILLTDSFFSISGIIFPLITNFLLNKKIIWYWIYVIIAIIYLKIFILTVTTKFPVIKKFGLIKKTQIKLSNINIIYILLGALLYILGQLSFISWIPEYTNKILGIKIQYSAKIISTFWFSYMIGMWFFSFLIKYFDLYKITTFLIGTSTIIMYIIIHIKNIIYLKILVMILGFFSSAIYSNMITIASMQNKFLSPQLVNLVLTFGTIGSMLSLVVTSKIIHNFGLYAILKFSNLLYLIVFFLFFIIQLKRK